MDGRMNPFSYLVEEVEQEFFQKTAEEIAVDLRREESANQAPEIPVRFQKLANLVYQSNQHGLMKEASESIFSDMDSYESILNKIAAASYWEPLGMTKSAFDFLTVLEEAGVDEGELTKFAEYIIEDTIGTDALIEASMEKEAGDTRPIEEIYDELIKESGVWGSIGRGLLRGAKAVFKPGKFSRAGEALQKVTPSISGKVKGFLSKRRLGQIQAHSQYSRRLHQQRKALQSQLATAGSSKAVEIGEKLKGVNENIKAIKNKMLKIRGKRRAALGEAKVEKIPTAPKKAPKPSTEGAAKAREAATPPPSTGGLKPGEVEAGAKRLYERGSRYGEEKSKRYGARHVGPEDTGKKSPPGEGGGYREKKPKPPASAPERAPGPRPPKEAVEGKGMGVMDAWSKWGREGWEALTDVEKSRLVRAGVMAGGGLATYKTVFGD